LVSREFNIQVEEGVPKRVGFDTLGLHPLIWMRTEVCGVITCVSSLIPRRERDFLMTALCCQCPQEYKIWGELWWGTGKPEWVFYDDLTTSETYKVAITHCPACGMQLKRKDLEVVSPIGSGQASRKWYEELGDGGQEPVRTVNPRPRPFKESKNTAFIPLLEEGKLRPPYKGPLKLTVDDWIPGVPVKPGKRRGLSHLLPTSRWNRIRKKIYVEHDYRCSSCGIEPRKRPEGAAAGFLNCHEIWEYDDIAFVQTLVGFTALCSPCHRVKHGILLVPGCLDRCVGVTIARELWGWRQHRAEAAKAYQEELNKPKTKQDLQALRRLKTQATVIRAIEHFFRVNGCDLATGARHLSGAYLNWKRRSKFKWKIDFGEFAGLL
jgi:hypothetical protein